MEQNRRRRRKKKNRGSGLLIFLIVLLAAALIGLVWLFMTFDAGAPAPVDPTAVPTEIITEPPTTEPPATLPPEPEHVVSTATIVSTGDLLMHGQLINDARQEDGSYDFSYIFPYLTSYISAADFAVANLETTLGGTAQKYQGNPMFNCPDDIVDAAKAAGFDLLLTANNHSYDTHQAGYERTLRVIREKGLQTLGTMLNGDEPKYAVQNINGINIGMICYTYEDSLGTGNPPALNYNSMNKGGYDILNCFRAGDPEPFYQELSTRIAEMKADGAEAIVLYIHWGQEYKLAPNANQTAMAQRLCDLGVDVIIGGHPHVVEPVDLLTSTVDPSHKTVCLYSMGNAVSNQRNDLISNIATPHTEDGLLFNLTFSKYSDGTVYLEDASIIPTWVRAIDVNGNTVVNSSGVIKRYEILPLDEAQRDSWQMLFGINDSTLLQLQDSWQRTTDLTAPGIAVVKQYLTDQRITRDNNYRIAVGLEPLVIEYTPAVTDAAETEYQAVG